MEGEVKVRGLSALAANFRAFDRECQRTVKAAVRRSGEDTREAAKSLAPIDTGFLYATIEDTYSPNGMAFTVGCDPAAYEAEGLPYYPPYVEFGTESSPAQPFLFPAFEAIKPHFQRDVSNAIRASMGKVSR